MNQSAERRFFWLFALLTVVGLAADQASKYGIFTYLYSEDLHPLDIPNVPLLDHAFRLEAPYIHIDAHGRRELQRDPGDGLLSPLRTVSGPCLPRVNRGALFGIGNGDNSTGGMNHLFAIISIVAAGFIVVWARRPSVAHDRFLSVALGLILGGTLGNLYDRIVFSGVRDFLHWYYAYDWPVFNIADCCLVCGASVLLIHSFFVYETPNEPAVKESLSGEPAPLQTTSAANGV